MDLSFLAPVIAFAGLIFGSILHKVAREEVIAGKRYFLLAKRATLYMVIIASLIYAVFAHNPFVIILAVIAGALAGYSTKRAPCVFLGIIAAAALSTTRQVLLLLSSFIFIHGFFYEKSRKQIIISALYFFLPFILLFFELDTGALLSFAASALIMQKS